jgi:hypothetical protein
VRRHPQRIEVKPPAHSGSRVTYPNQVKRNQRAADANFSVHKIPALHSSHSYHSSRTPGKLPAKARLYKVRTLAILSVLPHLPEHVACPPRLLRLQSKRNNKPSTLRPLKRIKLRIRAFWCFAALTVTHAIAQSWPDGPRPLQGLRAPLANPAGTLPAAAPGYTYTLFDDPGSFNTNGFGINLGAATAEINIVGGLGTNAGYPIGFSGGFLMRYEATKTLSAEVYRPVNLPGATQQAAAGINDGGDIVGYYSESSGLPQGYLESGGTFTTIDVPFSGATWTVPFGINNAGAIVGYWLDSSTSHGFLLSGGTYTSFDYPGATFTVANGINNHGEIVGFYGDASGVYHGFSLLGGTYTSIDAPETTATEAYGVNDAGDIVGTNCLTVKCADNFVEFQGFLLSGGVFTTITVPGANASAPVGIDDKGVMVGVFYDPVGHHSFLAIPTQ